MSLFDPQFVYPHDRTGAYVEVTGAVTALGEFGDSVRVEISTEKGVFSGWAEGPLAESLSTAALPLYARIRVYESGGGRYPDNAVITVSKEPLG